MATQHVFLCQIVDARQMISALIWLHALQKLNSNRAVRPCDVPLTVLSFGQMIFKVKLCRFLDYIVVRVLGVHDHALCSPS